ncbi:helix-turn-helix transcriptional regulator [Brevundimonas sp. 1080]|uniref:helix-turn-helix domain-containing protein n=1 Tax=Brevundimonas sp. 1080 TaxID=3156405 RepID=UPI0033972FC3
MRLSDWRKSMGWPQSAVAKRLGLRSKAQISGYENGSLTPTAEIAIAIDRMTDGLCPVWETRPDLHDVRVIRAPTGSQVSA